MEQRERGPAGPHFLRMVLMPPAAADDGAPRPVSAPYLALPRRGSGGRRADARTACVVEKRPSRTEPNRTPAFVARVSPPARPGVKAGKHLSASDHIHAARCHPPIAMNSTHRDITMKRGIRPCRNAVGQAVFDRVVMNVIDMRPQIVVVADRVLPETPGPQRGLPATAPWNACATGLQRLRESALEDLQASRIPIIAFGQTPDSMQVIRQHHHRNDLERAFRSGLPQRPTQGVDLLDQRPRRAIRQRQREEICAPGDTIASIEHHRSRVRSSRVMGYRKNPRLG